MILAPNMILLTVAANPLYLALGGILTLLAAASLLYPRRLHRRRDSLGRSLSPAPEKTRQPEQENHPTRRPSLSAFLTTILPRRVSTSSDTDTSSTSTPRNAELPNTTRTPAEIAAYGPFPDYASLSGVPLPKPYPEFDIARALPRPYRPFRWAYHQTMSFKKLEPDWWLELENTYLSRIAQRKELFEKHGKNVLQMLPGSEAACNELMEMVLQFLCARYPHYFKITGAPGEEVLINKILNKVFRIRTMEPLKVLLENIPEDFAITLRNQETGDYEFRAGVICSSLGWNVGTKIGKNLREIHAPIPDYREKMAMSMDRYFSKMPTHTPIQRGSWGLEHGQPLYMPPGDPHMELRSQQSPDLKLSDVFLRVDWQTLRRLPLSGAIVFNFKALFTPIKELRDEPGVPAVVLECLEKGKKTLMEYKGTWHVEHVVVPELRRWREEQIEKGMVERGWEVQTLEEYPMFRGWEEKWRGMQGF